MSSYTKGPYDKDEGYKGLEEQLTKVEKDDFGGKKAARIFYVSPTLHPTVHWMCSCCTCVVRPLRYGADVRSPLLTSTPCPARVWPVAIRSSPCRHRRSCRSRSC